MTSLTPLGTLLCAAVADELADLGTLVEDLGGTLCSDPEIALRHTMALQAIDLIAQRSRECADLLQSLAEGTCSRAAVEKVRLTHVKERVRAHVFTN